MIMEKESIACFNSPVIQKNTPIKRLGLSRKRKSRGPECKLDSKIRASSENFPVSLNQSDNHLSKTEIFTTAKDGNKGTIDSGIHIDDEINLLNERIAEKEEKLQALRSLKNNIVQLEELIELWKNGCKSAFLYFSELLRERHGGNIDFKSILNKLGIWEVMFDNFGSDPDISLMDYCQ